MHPGTQFLEGVDGPVRAVGRLEHHLRVLAGACHHAVETVDAVEDLGGRLEQSLAAW